MPDTDFKTLSREMEGRQGLTGSTIMLTIFALLGLLFIGRRGPNSTRLLAVKVGLFHQYKINSSGQQRVE